MIIGQPKSLSELPPFPVSTIEELAKGMEQQLVAGTPAEIPTMMPIGQLAQIARTMQAYVDIAQKLVDVAEEAEAEGKFDDDISAAVSALAEEAHNLLSIEAPKVVAKSNLLSL